MNDKQLLEQTERYLNGEMSTEERLRFEMMRKEDADVESRVKEHEQFTGMLKSYGDRMQLQEQMDRFHDQFDIEDLTEEVRVHPSWIVQLWRSHHSKISVAASLMIFTILATLFISGYFNNSNSKYTELRQEIGSLKRQTAVLKSSTTQLLKDSHVAAPGKYRGTGFAVSSDGYVVTNYHVIYGNDSVYVQNAAGDSFKTKLVYSEPQNDIAVLKIVDTAFKALSPIPYTFRRSKADLAEDVYTLGYPSDSPVFGGGYLTSSNGINGDTVRYQVSIPVDFGNSGGPLIDGRGNVIGIIDAKQNHVEGAHFAIKSSYLVKALQSDSLVNKVTLNSKNMLAGLSRPQLVKKLQNYVFMVKVY